MQQLRILFCFLFTLSAFYVPAQQCAHRGNHAGMRGSAEDNLRSDTVDVLHYTVNLSIDFEATSLSGYCAIKFRSKLGAAETLSLDLLRMQVDSVRMNNQPLSFGYNDTLLHLHFPAPVAQGDTAEVVVYYRGQPQTDPSGWGGFYFQNGYAFNLGVGFASLPHNFGRVWHPCFDNFVERATYEFNITSPVDKKAYCNGYLQNDQVSGSLRTRTWYMPDPIPSYLASIAVADYTHVEQQYVSQLTGLTTPVWLISLPADTSGFKASFVNLFSAIQTFEESYGAHHWNKIGFVTVPFSSGAMEHATNIAFPLFAVGGSTFYETLMAHELAHHWWGDLVTCRTAQDMWINEGMASYSERVFLEKLYGWQRYLAEVRSTHKEVLWKAHIDDGGYHALSAVPEAVTYGTHSYSKGADVAHTLRGYLGDSLFFAGLRHVITQKAMQNISSEEFRDALNEVTGIEVSHFFRDWVLNPGFPHFSIDSMQVSPSGGHYEVRVYVRQKLKAAPAFYESVPIQLTFRDASWNVHHTQIQVSGEQQHFTLIVPFLPSYAALNEDERISDAITASNLVIHSPGLKDLSYANFQVTVQSVSDSALLRVSHNWVAADALVEAAHITVSPDRYWKVEGIRTDAFTATAKFLYNGSTTGSGYLDNELMGNPGSVAFTEDSLVLLYRRSAAELWREYPRYSLAVQGSKTDKSGAVVIDSLAMGEYALGLKTGTVSVSEKVAESLLAVYPNPASEEVQVEWKGPLSEGYRIQLSDMQGRVVYNAPLRQGRQVIPLSGLSRGHYLISVLNGIRYLSSGKLVVE